ncbi:MAG: tRNA (adenosine(37)-N6)-threonylcarbamoyltransferase complex ATPase subunit type 1 TsaE [Rhodovibrionaceae bacterium]
MTAAPATHSQDEAAIRLSLNLQDEAATAALARRLAGVAERGDVFALQGDLGCGKTAFARAFINALPGAQEEVPSPTFTLAQLYPRGDAEVWHFDLYRLERPEDAVELGLDEALSDGICLIEWPERLGRGLPRSALTLSFSFGAAPEARRIEISGGTAWQRRLAELRA